MRPVLPLLIVAALAACSSEPRFAARAPVPDARIGVRYSSIEVVQVTLPTYGAQESIYVRAADGAIKSMGPLWADDPSRAVTLQLARDIGLITGSVAAPSPWPYRDLPDVRVDVRIEDFLATAEGSFLLSGQYYIAPEEGGRGRARRFEYAVPVADPTSAASIVAARGAAVSGLSVEIVQNGLR